MIKLIRLITELLYQLMICVCHCFAVYRLFETNDFSLMKFTQVCYPCFKVPAGCITCATTGSVCYNLITVCLIIFGSKFVMVPFTSELAENTSGNFFQADIGAAIRETFRLVQLIFSSAYRARLRPFSSEFLPSYVLLIMSTLFIL